MELFMFSNLMLILAKLNVDAFLKSLVLMAKGMVGIFIVITVIYLITKLLNKLFPNKKDKEKKN